MPTNQMPRLGVAVTFGALTPLREWIFDHDRAIEIQDFVDPEILTGDTAPLIERNNRAPFGQRVWMVWPGRPVMDLSHNRHAVLQLEQ